MNGDAKAAAHFYGTGLHDTGAEFRHFQHFAVRNLVDFLRIGNDTGIGRIYAVNVGIDFTNISMDGTGNGNCRRIGATAAERRNITMTGDTLEACDDDDIALVQSLHDAARFQCQDAAFVKGVAGLDTGLCSRKGNSLLASFLESHSHEGDGDLFARRQEHVHFTAVSLRSDLLG